MSNGGHHPETEKPDIKPDPKKPDTNAKADQSDGKKAGLKGERRP